MEDTAVLEAGGKGHGGLEMETRARFLQGPGFTLAVRGENMAGPRHPMCYLSARGVAGKKEADWHGVNRKCGGGA